MPISKPITTPNGASVAFHKATRASYDVAAGTVAISVASWSTEDAYLSGSGLVWMWPVDAVPAALANIDAALAQIAPFDGGTVVTDDAQSLEAVQTRQAALLDAAYFQAIAQDVSFTTAGDDTRMYQSDPVSVSNASACMLGCQAAQAVPEGFYWVAADNTRVVFTYADLQAFAAALFAHGHGAFMTLQDLKASVRAAATVDAVKLIGWPAP